MKVPNKKVIEFCFFRKDKKLVFKWNNEMSLSIDIDKDIDISKELFKFYDYIINNIDDIKLERVSNSDEFEEYVIDMSAKAIIDAINKEITEIKKDKLKFQSNI